MRCLLRSKRFATSWLQDRQLCPEIDHDLRFLLTHYPAAYEVDRTTGANPIRQRLANLNEAGTLYGAIIYHKAPIAMRNLEAVIGAEGFRAGLQEYLKRHAFGNASWPDLVHLLGARTDDDLATWSRAWVEEPGRPTIIDTHSGDRWADYPARVHPARPARPRSRGPGAAVTLGYPDGERRLPVRLTRTQAEGSGGRASGAALRPAERPGHRLRTQPDASKPGWLPRTCTR
jgi:aminopeptidase N